MISQQCCKVVGSNDIIRVARQEPLIKGDGIFILLLAFLDPGQAEYIARFIRRGIHGLPVHCSSLIKFTLLRIECGQGLCQLDIVR